MCYVVLRSSVRTILTYSRECRYHKCRPQAGSGLLCHALRLNGVATSAHRPQAGSTTRLLRNSETPEVAVASAEQYGAVLAGGRITLSGDQRAEAIWQDVLAMAQKVGWFCWQGEAGSCAQRWGVTNRLSWFATHVLS